MECPYDLLLPYQTYREDGLVVEKSESEDFLLYRSYRSKSRERANSWAPQLECEALKHA